ncbi:MMPL family protein [Mycobacterium xenopi 3993]|nr:MMPL family protein [Mycobacterium xenopi 3993]
MDAPSMQAMMRLGHNFKEFDSNSTIMMVVEGQQPLGDAAHRYYDDIIRQLRQDPKHVQHIQDFWSDRLTAAGVQSTDAKGAYVQLNLAGNQGTTLANESVEAVRHVVERTPAPPGVKAYVTGPRRCPTTCTSSAMPAWRRLRCSRSRRSRSCSFWSTARWSPRWSSFS